MTEYAGVYGGSLYDLAAEENLAEAIKEELLTIRDIFRENPEYIRLLSEPSIAKEERTRMIEDAFGKDAERYLVNFLKILCEKGILNEYEGCVREYIKRFNADNGICEALVTSAVKLTDTQIAALRTKLEKTTGKTVSIETKIDPYVVAGIKVEIEGKQLDGTVSSRLSEISRRINETIL